MIHSIFQISYSIYCRMAECCSQLSGIDHEGRDRTGGRRLRSEALIEIYPSCGALKHVSHGGIIQDSNRILLEGLPGGIEGVLTMADVMGDSRRVLKAIHGKPSSAR